ncbi:MAG: oxidoreductase [Actinomycetota bacterium]
MLNDKVVVISGGAGLLGQRFCHAVAAAGGGCIVADRNEEAARQVAVSIQEKGGRAEAIAMDINVLDSIQAAIQALQQRHGRIDAVVNSAYPRNPRYGRKLEDVAYGDFCENLSLHLGGYFLVCQQFALHFRDNGGGSIINLGSVYGSVAPRFDIYKDTPMTMPVEYAAIKSGVAHLTRYFAKYFANTGVRVNCLSPGGILDGQPAPFLAAYREHCCSVGMLAPEDLNGTLIFLLSDASRFINGQELIVDDGFSL